jgi:hypothetical protein
MTDPWKGKEEAKRRQIESKISGEKNLIRGIYDRGGRGHEHKDREG